MCCDEKGFFKKIETIFKKENVKYVQCEREQIRTITFDCVFAYIILPHTCLVVSYLPFNNNRKN